MLKNYGPEVVKFETDVENTERGVTLFYIEVVVLSILFGAALKSWWVFGGILVGLFVMAAIRPLPAILMFFLSVGEGLFVFWICKAAWGLSAGGCTWDYRAHDQRRTSRCCLQVL